MDLMGGISTELRDENAEGIYTTIFPPFTVTSLPHAHVDSDSRAPGEPDFITFPKAIGVVESARSHRERWLGARVSGDARPAPLQLLARPASRRCWRLYVAILRRPVTDPIRARCGARRYPASLALCARDLTR